MSEKDYSKVQVLIVGAGPAGLSTAIKLKSLVPETEVVVIDKAYEAGNHNLSGAVLEQAALEKLLDPTVPDWRDNDVAKEVLQAKIDKDDIMFLLGNALAVNIYPMVKAAKIAQVNFGQMEHKGDYSVSISKLTKLLAGFARDMGVELLYGFAARDIVMDEATGSAKGVKFIDQGLDKDGNKQANYTAGEIIEEDFLVLAEGCDGLLTEKFIEKAGLKRKRAQLFSVGVKELIKVSDEQYAKFTQGRVVHAMGYPIWTPVLGPGMFGGGIVYAGVKEHLSVGMIVGADWEYCDFNPQDALTLFKGHRFVKQFIEGGTVVEAGAKMIPEGGWNAVPRDPASNAIGKGNVMILGDSAGFVNMLKIKGLHNAIESGIEAAQAIAASLDNPVAAADKYTEGIDNGVVGKEMRSAKNFRQTVAKFGPLFGMPMSVLGGLLPSFDVERDLEAMTNESYKAKPNQDFDKDTFTAVAATEHREEQPSHLLIQDASKCVECAEKFGNPCITFCPAGVYETIQGQLKPANPSNCLHCKTCQRKCPYDNIRWTVPEGSGGPRYKRM